MLDGFRFYMSDKTKFEERLNSQRIISLSSKHDIFTGVAKEYPKKGKWQNLNIQISESQSYVAGSLHKFFNMIMFEENQNYDDFTLRRLETSLNLLQPVLGNDLGEVTMIEMGFNIVVPESPSNYIKHRFLLFDFKPDTAIENFGGKGLLKEYKKTDYCWKIYDKTLQYNTESNVLRIELRITGKRVLTRLNIFKPEDLLKVDVLQNTFNFFINLFDNFLIVDNCYQEKLSHSEMIFWRRITSAKYWLELLEEKVTRRIREAREKKAIQFLNSKGLTKTHQFLKAQLITKFECLLSS